MTYLSRRYPLSLLHFIREDESGVCVNTHGHDFKMDITVSGEPDPVTGLSISRDLLDSIVEKTLLKPHHKSLINESINYGTGEAIAEAFLRTLKATEVGNKVVSLQLIETRKNFYQSLCENSFAKT